jgi:hypothetical protein
MTLSGLRKEVARGRLAVEVIAGKQFTTLADIARMRELCRVAEDARAVVELKTKKRRSPTSSSHEQQSPRETLLKKLESVRDQKPKP